MRSVGIDPSTSTGMVLLAEDHVSSSVVNFPGLKGIPRVLAIKERARELLFAWKPDVVVIEGYGFANKFTLTLMVEIGFSLRLLLHELQVPWYIAPPTVLKKFATGSGAAKKPQVSAAVASRWGFKAPSDDVVDAYVLAQIAKELGVNGVTSGLKGVERG